MASIGHALSGAAAARFSRRGERTIDHRSNWAVTLSALALLWAVAGCEPRVVSSAVPTSAARLGAPARPVRLSSLTVPPQARELGVVQAHSDQTDIRKIVPEFVARVSALGGNFGKIDDITTGYEMHAVTSTQTYSCGTTSSPRTCTRTVTNHVEVPTTRVLGRAFEVNQWP